MTRGVEVEARFEGGLHVTRQAGWPRLAPGLVQGITGRAPELDYGSAAGPQAAACWQRLRRLTGIDRVVRCRQVHGTGVVHPVRREASGVQRVGEADALVTSQPDLLLTVTVADCVPVFFVDPEAGVLGLAHAGWRGTAAGVVGATLEGLRELGAEPSSLHAHLGPAICGRCYEVGPEVVSALGLPAGARTVDLRAQIAEALRKTGIAPDRLTVSRHCTRCARERFFSYRAGDLGRRMCAFLGRRSR